MGGGGEKDRQFQFGTQMARQTGTQTDKQRERVLTEDKQWKNKTMRNIHIIKL